MIKIDLLKTAGVIIASLLILECKSATIDINYRDGDVTKPQYRISGPIVPGDFNKFTKLIVEEKAFQVVLNSPGGDLREAMKIGKLASQLGLITWVRKDDICASACFFIWIHGNPRFSYLRSRRGEDYNIGLHRPYLISPSSDEKSLGNQREAIRAVTAHMEELMISRRLIDLMMSRPSNDVYWLTRNDIDELGEYTPEVEELLISKCGYNRKSKALEFSLRYDQNRISEADAVKAKIDTEIECSGEITGERMARLRSQFIKSLSVRK